MLEKQRWIKEMAKPYALSSTLASHTCILISKSTMFAGVSLGDAASLVVAYSDEFFYTSLQDDIAICVCLGRCRLAAGVVRDYTESSSVTISR